MPVLDYYLERRKDMYDYANYENFLYYQQNIAYKLINKTTAYISTSAQDYYLSREGRDFITMFTQLEKLLFCDKFNEEAFYAVNYIYGNSGKAKRYEERIADHEGRHEKLASGLMIINSPSTHYIQDEQVHYTRRHLTAAEESFKVVPTHFLKIYTVENVLIIFTNKDLPFETIIALKRLQWSISKENITTPQPDFDLLLEAIANKNINNINLALNRLNNLPVFDEIKCQKLLSVFKTNNQRQIKDLENQIISKNSDCLYHENKIAELISEIVEAEELLEFYRNKKDDEEEIRTFIKYLLKHPYITDVSKIDDENVVFSFEAPIIYYDDYLIKKIIHNYTFNAKKILQAFLDKKYELMTKCRIQFNTRSYNIQNARAFHETAYIGHPHIDRYSCFGNHKIGLKDAAKSGDFYLATEQISQAVLNLNFSDGAVVNEMINTLLNRITVPTWRSKETKIIISTEELLEEYRNEEAQTNS